MPALPLNLDLPTMQQRWKAIIDPVVSGSANPPLTIGQPQKVASSTTSTTAFITLTTSPTVTINVQESSTFKVYGTIESENSVAGQNCYLQISCTQGSPQILFSQTTIQGQASASANGVSTSPYLLCMITQPGNYTFTLQMKVTGGTGTLRNDLPVNGQALIIEEIL